MTAGKKPSSVAVLMGSQSDWPVMRAAADMLDHLGISHEVRIISAHRTPEKLRDFALGAKQAGFQVIIAGAGGAAHLPGVTASMTLLPVLGVPIAGATLGGNDALYSIVQMPGGIPVGCLGIGATGAKNAALLAAQILSLADPRLQERLRAFRRDMRENAKERPEESE